jgi:hypothetical protein
MPCNPHPNAPHGFVRNASHDANEYVCECAFWESPDEVKQSLLRPLLGLLGDAVMVDAWWRSPNKAFNMLSPEKQLDIDSEVVKQYVFDYYFK